VNNYNNNESKKPIIIAIKKHKKTEQIKAYIDRDKLKEILDGRSLSWLHKKVVEMGVSIEYNAFNTMTLNKVDIKLTYALCISKVLNTTIEELFYLE